MKKLSGNTGLIKEVNVNIIREAIKNKPVVTKPQIAKETGLTTATVGTILNELLAKNEIIEINDGKSSGGRPAKEYSYNFDMTNFLIIFPFERKNSTFLSISVRNFGEKSLYREDRIVDKIDLETIKSVVENMKKKFPKIKVVGFGNTGTNEGDRIIFSDYSEIEGLNLTEELSIPVVIENDVNSAAIGFSKRKGISENYSTVYIFFPESYPPGSAILINGGLYKGYRNSAGEVANIKSLNWNKEIYENFEEFCRNASSLISTIASVLNPNCFILSGNFLSEKHISYIHELHRKYLPKSLVSEIYLTKNFSDDLIEGLKALCINRFHPQTILTKGAK